MNCCRLQGSFFKRKEIHFENAETWQRGTKDSWDLFELDRVWNWCYLNKGKMFSSSSSKWIYIYSSRCCIYKFETKFNTLSFWRKSQILEFYGGLFENDIEINFFNFITHQWVRFRSRGKMNFFHFFEGFLWSSGLFFKLPSFHEKNLFTAKKKTWKNQTVWSQSSFKKKDSFCSISLSWGIWPKWPSSSYHF